MTRTAVESGERAWLEAFNRGDAAAVAGIYADNARMLAPGVDVIRGRSAIEPFIKDFVATGAQLQFELLDVHEAGTLAVAVGTYRMTIPGAPDDRGKFVEVWAQDPDGAWRIIDDIFNSSEPAPA